MLKVYCYNRCTTCKKALKWLEDNGVAHEVIDIKAQHPDNDTLRKYYATSGLPLFQHQRSSLQRAGAFKKASFHERG